MLRTRHATRSLMSDGTARTEGSRRRKGAKPGLDHLFSDSASESGASVLSAFGRPPGHRERRESRKEAREVERVREERAKAKHATDSPLRRASRWLHQNNSGRAALWIGIALVVVVKCCVGLGGYSGEHASSSRCRSNGAN